MITETMELIPLIKEAKSFLTGFDAEFFERVWLTDQEAYKKRIEIIKFHNYDCVLDAGFGNGQWTICLAEKNKNVFGVEYLEARVKAVESIFTKLGLENIHLSQGNVEQLSFKDDFFNAIFSYSVIYFTDVKKTLSEFYRVLQPGGKLYFTTNGLGWYLMLLIEQHNKSPYYDPRQIAANAIDQTFKYFFNNKVESKMQLFFLKETLHKLLSNTGFKNIIIQPEGSINFIGEESYSFYKCTQYLGEDFIYDVYCEK
jgi:ubiquinone/menaquinone biosynthesis C-methylase UbiE